MFRVSVCVSDGASDGIRQKRDSPVARLFCLSAWLPSSLPLALRVRFSFTLKLAR